MGSVLGKFGFPDEKDLIAQALGLARASVPTPHSINRQYRRASRDVGGFSNALVSLLRGEAGDIGAAYDPSIAETKSANAAALARLGQLGPEYAVAGGAAGDTSLGQLLSGRASAAAYGAKQPGIAANRGTLAQTGIENARLDAMSQRRDALRSSFIQLYDQVRQRALAEAAASADISGSNRSFREGKREFNLNYALQQAGLAQDHAAASQSDAREGKAAFFAARDDALTFADQLFEGKTVQVPGSVATGPPHEETKRPSWDSAFNRMWSKYAPELLHFYGVPRRQITRMIRQALRQAGFTPPKKPGHVGDSPLPHD
jgi:hypothetical protein